VSDLTFQYVLQARVFNIIAGPRPLDGRSYSGKLAVMFNFLHTACRTPMVRTIWLAPRAAVPRERS
jgi:hypothetical protein